MKKKLLTLVLAMTLVMSSVMLALAAPDNGSVDEEKTTVTPENAGNDSVDEEKTTVTPDGDESQSTPTETTAADKGTPTETTKAPTETTKAPTETTKPSTQATSTDATQAPTKAPVKAVDTAVEESVAAVAALNASDAVKVSGVEKLTFNKLSTAEASKVVNLAAETGLATYVAIDLTPSADYKQGDKVEITLPLKAFAELKDAKYIDVFRVEAGKLVTVATGVEVKDGNFTFETNHFSTYVFAKGEKPSTSNEGTKTGDMSPIVPITIALVGSLAIFGAALVFKKKEEI